MPFVPRKADKLDTITLRELQPGETARIVSSSERNLGQVGDFVLCTTGNVYLLTGKYLCPTDGYQVVRVDISFEEI